LRQGLIELGWNERDACRLFHNLKGSLNQGANVLQTLRSNISDAHGSKKVFEPIVFDLIKWASLILRMLKLHNCYIPEDYFNSSIALITFWRRFTLSFFLK